MKSNICTKNVRNYFYKTFIQTNRQIREIDSLCEEKAVHSSYVIIHLIVLKNVGRRNERLNNLFFNIENTFES